MTEVLETILGHVSMTFKEGVPVGPATEHKEANKKDLRMARLQDLNPSTTM